jgi:hypothetical protein
VVDGPPRSPGTHSIGTVDPAVHHLAAAGAVVRGEPLQGKGNVVRGTDIRPPTGRGTASTTCS